MPKFADLSRLNFGRWKVVSYAGKQHWNCVCECGHERSVRADGLVNGSSTQCRSCATRESLPRLSHGGFGTPLYWRWAAMKFRCNNPSYPEFHLYGGRGIKVCARWNDSFQAFKDDMGNPPPGLSLDRINNDGDYEPGNCRWTTAKVQRNNQRQKSTANVVP